MAQLRLAKMTGADVEFDPAEVNQQYTALMKSFYPGAGLVVGLIPSIVAEGDNAPVVSSGAALPQNSASATNPSKSPPVLEQHTKTDAENSAIQLNDRSQTDPLIELTDSDETWFKLRKDGSIYKRGNLLLAKEQYGRSDVFLAHPLSPTQPAHVDFSRITTGATGTLFVEAHNVPGGDCDLVVLIDGHEIGTLPVAGDEWRNVSIPFNHNRIELQDRATGWYREHALLVYKIRPPSTDTSKVMFSRLGSTNPPSLPAATPPPTVPAQAANNPFDPQIENTVNDLAKAVDGFFATSDKIDQVTKQCEAAQNGGNLDTASALLEQLKALQARLEQDQHRAEAVQTRLETMDRQQVLAILDNIVRLNPQMPVSTQQQLRKIRTSMAHE